VPSDEVITNLVSSLIRVRRRVEIYESDGTTPWDIENWDSRLIDGSITIDRGREERRACDFRLENSDLALAHNPYDGFWYDKILKAFWGIDYQDRLTGVMTRWEIQVGEFMIDRIDEDRFPNAVKVTGRDYTKKCMITKLSQSISFPAGTAVEVIIKALASNAGITKFNLPVTNRAYAGTTIFARGTERWKVMKQIADTIGYEIYFAPNGYLTMSPYPDPTTTPLAWTFKPGGPDGSLVDYRRSSNDNNIFNHITVTGATNEVNGLTTTIFAEARNTNPNSPTRISRIGERSKNYDSDYLTTTEEAFHMATVMLNINSLEEYDVSFSSLILPWLDASMIVGVVEGEESEYVPKRFLLTNYTLPMALGPMTGTAKRVTIVGTTQGLG
jgi:hypothetical protein